MRVAASPVVEDLDELEDRSSQPILRWSVAAIEQSGLQGGEEALGDGVIGWRA